ncbi:MULTISPECIES: BCCT family transporter [Halorussus]|uniref:BCCT family transporter n=1 Tax=Halorussus TaxID=1070314 RepID=UPI0020A16DE5|nr:BCCT family transporter [Halorussus vallis]USZ74515.1 BCCT family transporter [Halorussus vallis]
MSSEPNSLLDEFLEEIDPVIFGSGVVVAVAFIVAYALSPTVTVDGSQVNQLGKIITDLNNWLWTNFSWFYLWAMLIFVAFTTFLIFGPWGKIRLGGEDTEPDHSFLTYFAMFFSAGIAAGIVFWGPAEAIYHFGNGTPLTGSGASAKAKMVGSLQYTFFHWGISAWSAYLIVGVPIAYFAYNKGAPFRFSTVLAPFIGVDDLEDSKWATLVDVVAVFGTMGGIATSLGFIGQQLLAGMEYQFGVAFGDLGTILTITGVTVLFTLSVVSGVDRGIKRLSQVNVLVFLVLGVVVFLVGFPSFVLNLGTQAVGDYLQGFVGMSLFTGVGSGDASFVGAWTVFYWAWWFSWAPFSGIFLAKISKGRTIREVTFVGVIATTLATVPWFMIVGGTSMRLQNSGGADILGAINEFGIAVSGYPLFGALPFGEVLSALFFLLVITFFVTSADSSTLGLAMLTTGGEEDPSKLNRLTWGVLQGLIASILVVIGGTNALQQAAIITGGPVAVVGLVAVYGMAKEFSDAHGRVLVQEGGDVRGDDMLIGSRSGPTGDAAASDAAGPTEPSEDD